MSVGAGGSVGGAGGGVMPLSTRTSRSASACRVAPVMRILPSVIGPCTLGAVTRRLPTTSARLPPVILRVSPANALLSAGSRLIATSYPPPPRCTWMSVTRRMTMPCATW